MYLQQQTGIQTFNIEHWAKNPCTIKTQYIAAYIFMSKFQTCISFESRTNDNFACISAFYLVSNKFGAVQFYQKHEHPALNMLFSRLIDDVLKITPIHHLMKLPKHALVHNRSPHRRMEGYRDFPPLREGLLVFQEGIYRG